MGFLKNFIGRLLDVKLKSRGTVCVNGQTYEGNSVIIEGDGNVIVNGEIVSCCDQKHISVEVNGDVDVLTASSGEVTAKDVGRLSTASGDVKCENVGGSIKTASGDVECTSVAGDVQTASGDVSARSIEGNVKTVSGDISK